MLFTVFPTVGTVVTIVSCFSLYSSVVLPAASNPSNNIFMPRKKVANLAIC